MNATPLRSFLSDESSYAERATLRAGKSQPKNLVENSAVAGARDGSARAMAAGGAHGRAREMARDLPRGTERWTERPRALGLAHADGRLPLAASPVFEAWFLARFATWLQSTFDNVEHVSRAFNVRHSTARNWWNGRNCASGVPVGIVFMSFPAATSWFLAEWEGR